MNLLSTALLLVLVLQLSLILLFAVKLSRKISNLQTKVSEKYDEIQEGLHDFVTAPDENTPSPLALMSQKIASMFGHSAAVEIKTTLMGKASGIARGLDAAGADVITEQIPMMGVMDAVPSLKKRVFKNPALLQLASMFFSKFGPSGSGNVDNNPPTGNNGHGNDWGEKLSRYK